MAIHHGLPDVLIQMRMHAYNIPRQPIEVSPRIQRLELSERVCGAICRV